MAGLLKILSAAFEAGVKAAQGTPEPRTAEWSAPPEARKTYVVFAPSRDESKFVFFELKHPGAATVTAIHKTIAGYENNKSARDYAGTIQPGSFNFVTVRVSDQSGIIQAAKAKGLKYEPWPVVQARYINAQRETAKSPQPPGRGPHSADSDQKFEDLLESMVEHLRSGRDSNQRKAGKPGGRHPF